MAVKRRATRTVGLVYGSSVLYVVPEAVTREDEQSIPVRRKYATLGGASIIHYKSKTNVVRKKMNLRVCKFEENWRQHHEIANLRSRYKQPVWNQTRLFYDRTALSPW
jgi:hypothetical protein